MCTKKIAAEAAIALLGLLVAAVMPAHPGAETVEQKTWIRSGKRSALVSLEERDPRPLPGKFAWFTSAKEVRSIATLNDTLWIGTEGGLFACRPFGDKAVPVSGPASASIRAIALHDGDLWVGGDGGMSVRSERGWKRFAGATNAFFGRVRCMANGESRLWIGTYGNGCGYVAGDMLTVLGRQDSLLDERVLSIAEETPDEIFFGTAGGLVNADSFGWKSLRYGSRLPIGAVTCMAFDEDRNLFLSTVEQGVSIFSFGRVQTFASGAGTPGPEVNALSLDPSGTMWAAGRSGIFIFDGSEWASHSAPGGPISKHRYLSLHHDEEGACYAGTDDGAVLVISRDAAREIAVPQSFSSSRVSRVRFCNGAVWLIAGAGIYSYKGSFAKASAPPEHYGAELTDLLVTEKGEIWATTRFGILHFTGRAWEVFDRRNGFSSEYFTRVSMDPLGTLWFATFENGIVSYSGGAWTAYGRENGLPADALADAIVDGAGNPWIVTRNGEVARFSQGVWEEMEPPHRATDAPDAALAADSLSRFDPAIHFLREAGGASRTEGETRDFCLGLDREGACLLGTRAGVYRHGTGGWQSLELPAPLRGMRPTAVMGSARGDMWLGTAGGGILLLRDGQWRRLHASNGLSDDYIRSLCEDQKGSIWIGTQFGGLTRYSAEGS